MYTDWNDYIASLHGKLPLIPETEFPYWADKASARVSALTLGRLKNEDNLSQHADSVTACICELAEYLFLTADSLGLTGVSVTGHSVSYDKSPAREKEIILRHLGDSGLLYRGGFSRVSI